MEGHVHEGEQVLDHGMDSVVVAGQDRGAAGPGSKTIGHGAVAGLDHEADGHGAVGDLGRGAEAGLKHGAVPGLGRGALTDCGTIEDQGRGAVGGLWSIGGPRP